MSEVVALLRAAHGVSSAVAGVPLVVHAVRRLMASELVDHVLVAVPESTKDTVGELLLEFAKTDIRVINGPVDPNGIAREFRSADVVLVHDVRHAFAGPELVRRVITGVRERAGAVVPVQPCSDTVKQLDSAGTVVGMPDRAQLRVMQSPQGFPADSLRAGSSPAALLRDAHPVEGDPHARRLVSEFDLIVADVTLAGADS